MSTSPRRPRLHLTAPAGWVNDPLGLTHHAGEYHLFYQHVPGATAWEPGCHWGHATSPDLLHWTHHEPALSPGDGDDGCWSGCVTVPPDGGAMLFYTSVQRDRLDIGRVRVARPADHGWRSWTKGEVVAELPEGLRAVAHRDPVVVRDGDTWLMLLGAGLADGTATVLVHTSPDLRTWEYAGPLAGRPAEEREPLWLGVAWECPQLLALGDRHVLTLSAWEPAGPVHEAYGVGRLVDGRLEVERWARLTHGPSSYAGTAFVDTAGRRGLVHWLRGVADPEEGWAGALSLPHVVTLDGDRLVTAPHPALDALRGPGAAVAAGGREEVPGTCEVRWEPGPGGRLAVTGRDGGAVLDLHVDADGVHAETGEGAWAVPLPGAPDEVRLVLDGPVAEVFAGGEVLALPVPVPPAGPALAVSAGRARVHRLGG